VHEHIIVAANLHHSGTLSTRIANLLCIIHSVLSRLSCRAYAWSGRSGGPLPHADRQTRDRHDLPTSQPDNRTAAVLPVPNCKLGITLIKHAYVITAAMYDKPTDIMG